jgi:hypothetical protein
MKIVGVKPDEVPGSADIAPEPSAPRFKKHKAAIPFAALPFWPGAGPWRRLPAAPFVGGTGPGARGFYLSDHATGVWLWYTQQY